jgi:hypothetical protein
VTGQGVASCWGCTHRRARLRAGKSSTWCAKYRTIPTARCADYLYQAKAIAQAMDYYRRGSLKHRTAGSDK